jgi:hypothetical protein
VQVFIAKQIKSVSKLKKKNVVLKKIEKGCWGTNWPRPRSGPGPARPTRPKRYATAAFRMLTGGAHLLDVFLDETDSGTACSAAV